MSLVKKAFNLLVFILVVFIGMNTVKAEVKLKTSTIINETSSTKEYTIQFFANITGTSKFNYTSGKLILNNVEIVSFEQNGSFVAELDRNTLKYKAISNKTYTSKDVSVAYATLRARSLDKNKDCSVVFEPDIGRLAITNTFTINKYAYKDGKEITSVKAGESFQYKIKVKSAKNELTTDSVIVTDTIPRELEVVSVSNNGIINGQNITWNLGKFNQNEEREVELTVYVKAKKDSKGQIKNTAILTVGDKEFTSDTPINVLYSDISILKKASKSLVAKGEKFYYTINIKNNGTGISEDIIVEDTLDDDLELISSSVTNNGRDNNLIFDIGKLEAGKTKIIKLEVKVKDITTKEKIRNISILKENGKDPIEDSADIDIIEEEILPDISIEKKANVSEAKRGEEIIYTITIKNNNNLDLYDILITDIITNAEFVNGDLECVESDRKTCKYGLDLKGNEIYTITLVAKVLEDIDGDTVKNVATLTYEDINKNSETVVKVLDPSQEPNEPITPDNPDEPLPDNPDTGIIVSIAIIIIGILSSLGIYLCHKRKNKFYKI